MDCLKLAVIVLLEPCRVAVVVDCWIFDSYITTYNCPACKFIPTLRSSRNTDRLFHLIFPCSFRISCSAFTCIDRQCAFFSLNPQWKVWS